MDWLGSPSTAEGRVPVDGPQNDQSADEGSSSPAYEGRRDAALRRCTISWRRYGSSGGRKRALADPGTQVADRLYPPERLAALELLNPPRPAPAVEDGEEDLNKATLVAHSGSEEEEEDEEEDQSIEASIARELAALRSARPSRKKWGADGDKSAGVTKPKVKGPKPRFQSLETHTECCELLSLVLEGGN